MFLTFRNFSRKHSRISKGALERSLSTNLSEKKSPRKIGQPLIFTLDPNKFAEKKQQCLDIGSLQSFSPRISLLKQSSHLKAVNLHYDSICQRTHQSMPCYPPDTKAFLYYSMPPERPRIAGELRLRVTSSDPMSFESGSDLLLRDGQPWSRPIYALSKYYFALYEKLREDRLIQDDLDTVLSTLPLKRPSYARTHFLYTLNDPFIIDFNNYKFVLFVITELGVESLSFGRLFSDRREMWKDIRPYTGRALARFERSTLPDHKGTRTVVIRFLKIITPLKCVIPDYDDNVYCPKEGELHRKSRKKDHEVWSADIDKSKSKRGLQLLWDI